MSVSEIEFDYFNVLVKDEYNNKDFYDSIFGEIHDAHGEYLRLTPSGYSRRGGGLLLASWEYSHR